MNRIYLCIDLKSFYASVECVARELDPLTTNLVVADKERTDKTICLAVTPSLKAYASAAWTTERNTVPNPSQWTSKPSKEPS